jgi:hypothetical protein
MVLEKCGRKKGDIEILSWKVYVPACQKRDLNMIILKIRRIDNGC